MTAHLVTGPDLTPIQAEVSAICAEVLGLTQVGLDDDLYELGGDSQQAVLIALRIEAFLPVELPLEVMESSANVRAIAAWIDAEMACRQRQGQPPAGIDDP